MAAQLYLITPEIADAQAFLPKLNAVLEAATPAVVRVQLAPLTDPKRALGLLVPAIQRQGCIALIDPPEDTRAIARLGLDGVHLRAPGTGLGAWLEALQPERVVGMGGLKSRHAAMEAGEKGVDYVMFGEPAANRHPATEDARSDTATHGAPSALPSPDLLRTLEMARWWVPIFTTPAVVYAPDYAAIVPLVQTGAEFIALGPWLFDADNAAALARAAALAVTNPLAETTDPAYTHGL